MANRDRNLLLLFDRPQEPLFFPRQDGNKEVVFEVSPEYVADRYKPIYGDLQGRFGSEDQDKITVKRPPSCLTSINSRG
ncbi:hypothetical protein GE061_016981 [Apolygus lucorum]|uniref:Uncharacterized protein n=1 Tax=Apolygus lucorum TaxID=248454 RepID=A0A8S9XHQ2_APOLU|nr:hypothetical protein GE061_016981 [Apolygus lucorum]